MGWRAIRHLSSSALEGDPIGRNLTGSLLWCCIKGRRYAYQVRIIQIRKGAVVAMLVDCEKTLYLCLQSFAIL